MQPYQLNIPTKAYFGRNILKEALKDLESMLRGNVLVVTTGRSLIRMGYTDMLIKMLEQSAFTEKLFMFDQISANPKLSEVRKGIQFGKQKNINVVVGFGGGSAMDAAKAIAVGIGANEEIEEFYVHGKEPGEETLPVLAIPTTAGTGSEFSKAAIITDEIRKKKSGIRGKALYPAAAVVDSMFTESVPDRITMETGFDVLAHAIESYVSKAASPYTQMQSEYAIHIVGKYLPLLKKDLQNREARENMSFASMIMGINLGNASTALPHRLQYPLGAHTDTSHGAGLAALFTAWAGYEWVYSQERMERAVQLLTGEDRTGKERITEGIRTFIKMCGLPSTLRELEVCESELETFAFEVSGNLENDLASQEENVILKIYQEAL